MAANTSGGRFYSKATREHLTGASDETFFWGDPKQRWWRRRGTLLAAALTLGVVATGFFLLSAAAMGLALLLTAVLIVESFRIKRELDDAPPYRARQSRRARQNEANELELIPEASPAAIKTAVVSERSRLGRFATSFAVAVYISELLFGALICMLLGAFAGFEWGLFAGIACGIAAFVPVAFVTLLGIRACLKRGETDD